MLFRIIGLITVFAACAGAGLLASLRLGRRVSQLESFLSAVAFMATEIRYNALPVETLFARLEAQAEYGALRVFGLCRERLKRGEGMARAWDEALEEARPALALTEEDIAALRRFGRSLGATDVEGQLSNCDATTALLRTRWMAARDERQKRGNLYASVGVLGGVFFVLLLI